MTPAVWSSLEASHALLLLAALMPPLPVNTVSAVDVHQGDDKRFLKPPMDESLGIACSATAGCASAASAFQLRQDNIRSKPLYLGQAFQAGLQPCFPCHDIVIKYL